MNRKTSMCILSVIILLILSVWIIRGKLTSGSIPPGGSVVLCDFEDPKIWDVSPEQGFEMALSSEHRTEGEHALQVTYPEGQWPSINSRKINFSTRNYDALTVDIYNPHEGTLSFSIRLDDVHQKKITIPIQLEKGNNHLRIARSQIGSKINPYKIRFIVFFFNKPSKRYTLHFDNMRFERDGAVLQDGSLSSDSGLDPMPFRRAVSLPKPEVQQKGTVKVAFAKIVDKKDENIFLSSGIPFSRGQLLSEKDFVILDDQGNEIPLAIRILARWPQDQSIRSVLVQFNYKIEHVYEYATLEWGRPRTTKDLDIVEPRWDFPEGLIVMPAEWMCQSQVVGEQIPLYHTASGEYDKHIVEYFPEIIALPKTGNLNRDGYYSTPHVFYQLFVRTGEIKYFIEARKELVYYRENEIQHKGKYRGGSVTAPKLGRYVYVQALVDDYLLTGDPRSREVAGFMAEFFVKNFSPKKAFYAKKSQRFWTERLFAFPFLGILSYYELSLDHKYLKVADTYMENLYKTQLEWPSRGGFIHNLYAHDPEEGARRDEYGGSPFMTGLLLEAVVKYHQITKSEIAADSIFRALDWLIREGLTNQGDSFKYLTADRYAASDGEPDLNLLIVHALGYGYRLSGYKQESYVETGLKVFERGVRDAYLGRRKHFNQNYRSSGHFLAYIDQGLRQKEILKSSAQPIVSENETSTEKKEISRDTIFYYEGFEFSVGRFESPGAVAGISVDNQMRFKGRRSVLIQSKAELSDLSAGINWDRWQLERYSNMHLAYRIPPETPVGLRVKTQYGDWICLGGTKNFLCAGTPVTHRELLTDDGAWHEINIDVQALVTSLLPGINNLTGFQFHTNGNARRNNRFWIDEFIILK